MEKKNLLILDLQKFAEEEGDVGAEETEAADPSEEETEGEETETGETNGDAEPHEQTPEENARYAAMRRRAEEDARRRYEQTQSSYNQRIAAMCQGITHPITGRPIQTMDDYLDALSIQQRQATEAELHDKGIDPMVIDRMIAENPVVQQAQQVIEQSRMVTAETQLQNDVAELGRYDPSIKGVADLAAMENFPEILAQVERGASLVEAYKMVNFDNFMAHTNEAARQKAINQMRGKAHLPTQPSMSGEDDFVEVPKEIMANWKAEGKTEKQIRELYKTVAKKLHLN